MPLSAKDQKRMHRAANVPATVVRLQNALRQFHSVPMIGREHDRYSTLLGRIERVTEGLEYLWVKRGQRLSLWAARKRKEAMR